MEEMWALKDAVIIRGYPVLRLRFLLRLLHRLLHQFLSSHLLRLRHQQMLKAK